MSLLIVCGLLLLGYCALFVIKELAADHKVRWEERVMADYLRAEDARWHRNLLEQIEIRRRETTEDMIRAAQEAGAAMEIEPR